MDLIEGKQKNLLEEKHGHVPEEIISGSLGTSPGDMCCLSEKRQGFSSNVVAGECEQQVRIIGSGYFFD